MMSPGRTHDFRRSATPFEQGVADVMPERVVDDLEAVEVEKHDRHKALDALGVDHRLLQAFEQQHAVRQAREHVVVGEEAQPLLGLAPLGDVLDDGHEHRRRLVAHELQLHLHRVVAAVLAPVHGREIDALLLAPAQWREQRLEGFPR